MEAFLQAIGADAGDRSCINNVPSRIHAKEIDGRIMSRLVNLTVSMRAICDLIRRIYRSIGQSIQQGPLDELRT